MNKRHIFALLAFLGVALLLTLASNSTARALIPSGKHRVAYRSGGSLLHYEQSKDDYIRHVLPYEWMLSASDDDALRAGAVIIRSGVYWRVNRSVLFPDFQHYQGYPHNNCYMGSHNSWVYYTIAPDQENWNPYEWDEQANPGNPNQMRVQTCVNDTYGYHAEYINQPAGWPDPLITLRYNNGIQDRTIQGTGVWQALIWYAYRGDGSQGSPYNPNLVCNESTDLTNNYPIWRNN